MLPVSCFSDGIVGSTDGGTSFDAGTHGVLRALRIDPESLTLVDDGREPGERAELRLIGTFGEGVEVDLTDRASWTLENVSLGGLDTGSFTSGGVGGRSTITATIVGRRAAAELTVVLELTVLGEGVGGDAPTRFDSDPALDEPGEISIVYPSDGTMLPRNLDRITHQWTADSDLRLFEVRFDSEFARLRFYTRARELPIDGEAWRWLAQTHAGASVRVVVRGVSDGPSAPRTSQEISESFSEVGVRGAIYYWSTGAQGVMRAQISSASSELFYDDPVLADDRGCVACHTVSRDGRRLAVAYGGERLREVRVSDREVLIPSDEGDRGPNYGWGTFDPGATRLLYADDGELALLDADTGALVEAIAFPSNPFVTHPDWSPDGTFVAVAFRSSGGRGLGNQSVEGTSIARIPVSSDGRFGEPTMLVESTERRDTLSFPSVSPDSQWIAYVRSEGSSKDNERSVLELVRSDGSQAPIVLTRLNSQVGDADGVRDLGNSMPTWAPSRTEGLFWLAFSSLRDYGLILQDTEEDQLWGAAVDPSRAAAGDDPSYPAFWMSFQQLDEANHRAFWALGGEEACPPPNIELCDRLDNDCDGVVDEMCCEPSEERCGDGIDNDCDGVADEGCGCRLTEDCTNGIDDDCDLAIDREDEDCDFI